jgi:hypothetical protein
MCVVDNLVYNKLGNGILPLKLGLADSIRQVHQVVRAGVLGMLIEALVWMRGVPAFYPRLNWGFV